MMRALSRSVVLGTMFGSMGFGLGCANDTTGPAPLNTATVYWQVTLNHHAITMAPAPRYDTLQLRATSFTAAGALLADTGVTTWTSGDTNSVRVSATGLVTAIAPVSGVAVIVSRTIGLIRRADTAFVNVNDTTAVPHAVRLNLQPDPNLFGIKNYVQLTGTLGFRPSVLDASGDTIPNVAFRITSLTPNILYCHVQNFGVEPLCNRQAAGHARLLAEATVYGVRFADTVSYIVGWPTIAIISVISQTPANQKTPVSVFLPADDTIAVGGDIAWYNQSVGAIDVVFDNPSAAQAVDSATYLSGFASAFGFTIPNQGGGNILAFAPLDTGALRGQDTLGTRARKFPVAGAYRYHSVLAGTSGVIHVLPEFQVP